MQGDKIIWKSFPPICMLNVGSLDVLMAYHPPEWVESMSLFYPVQRSVSQGFSSTSSLSNLYGRKVYVVAFFESPWTYFPIWAGPLLVIHSWFKWWIKLAGVVVQMAASNSTSRSTYFKFTRYEDRRQDRNKQDDTNRNVAHMLYVCHKIEK